MALNPGDKLGPYEIVEPIGKGGMGEVYRARDPRLNRDVAIKISAEQFSERFTREARAIASLNHTNICHLYDVGPNYLVMEFVEGPDVTSLIKAGPLDFGDALPIIQQLIDGIEAAHEKNIIHRDLKPANIKITPEGIVKILDFGLAKAMEAPSPEADPGNSPTLTMGATQAGTILGTAAYMAPEQAKGKTADKRSDIWSFGVIVYELLTGKRMFAGESAVEILGGVLNKEPEISAAPPRVHKLLEWCLEKDRKKRLAAISDARRLLEQGESTSPTPAAQSKVPWMVAAAGALAAVVAIALWAPWRSAPAEEPHIRFQVQPPEKGVIDVPRLSPDGRLLAFTSNNQVWIHSFETLESHAVAGTEGASYPFWSPQSTDIGFFAEGSLKRIAVSGGPARVLAPAPGGIGGSWNRDDVILYAPTLSSPLFKIPAAGGDPVAATEIRGAEFHILPEFLPDGNHFLFGANGGAEVTGVNLGSLDGMAPVRLVPQLGNAVFSRGHLLYARGDTLMAQPFDTEATRFTGEAFPVVEHLLQNLGYSVFSASDTGMLAYVAGAGANNFQLAWKDRSGNTMELFGPPGNYERFRLSPDENQITYDVRLADVWVLDAARGVPSRLTFDPAEDNVPMWSADGTKIVWPSHRGGSFDLYVKAANGTGQDQLLVKMGTPNGWGMDWSKDGHLLYQRPGEGTGQDLWVVPIDSGGAAGNPEPYLNAPYNEGAGRFSPDSKWVAYTSNENGISEVFVQSFPISGAKFQISAGGGYEPQWSGDGKELFYVAADRTLMAVPITKTAAEPFRPGLPVKLFNVGRSMGDTLTARSYAASQDGRRFLVPVADETADATPATVLLNWRNGFK